MHGRCAGAFTENYEIESSEEILCSNKKKQETNRFLPLYMEISFEPYKSLLCHHFSGTLHAGNGVVTKCCDGVRSPYRLSDLLQHSSCFDDFRLSSIFGKSYTVLRLFVLRNFECIHCLLCVDTEGIHNIFYILQPVFVNAFLNPSCLNAV